MEKLLTLNPGSTSTRIACYEDEYPLFVESISHSADTIAHTFVRTELICHYHSIDI